MTLRLSKYSYYPNYISLGDPQAAQAILVSADQRCPFRPETGKTISTWSRSLALGRGNETTPARHIGRPPRIMSSGTPIAHGKLARGVHIKGDLSPRSERERTRFGSWYTGTLRSTGSGL